MPTRDGYDEGVPSWVDLATPDVEGAKKFYGDLFGWEFSQEETESTPYTMATRNGLSAAGIGQLPDDAGMPSVWSTYFAVENADATASKITENGGALVMGPMDVMDAGRMAFASDPTGAVFGIWEARDHFGAQIVNEHGSLNWNELTSNDLETALGFYGDVLGHTHETTEGANGPYTALKADDKWIAGAMAPPMPEIPNHWGVYFAVDDAEAAAESVSAGGGTKVFGPFDIPEVGIITGFADPWGAHFTTIQLASPVP